MAELCIVTLNVRGMRGKLPNIENIIKTHTPDFLLLQETNIHDNYSAKTLTDKLGLGTGVFSLGGHCRGTAILKTSNRWDMTPSKTDSPIGRFSSAIITNKTETYRLVNIYGPAQRGNKQTFYKDLDDTLSTFKENIILAGDFNVTLENRDIKGHTVDENNLIGRAELQSLVNTHNLKDSYREIDNENTDMTYTNKHINRSSRIDRIYVNKEQTVSQCIHLDKTLTFTDHKAVMTIINGQDKPHTNKHTRKTSPHWLFNNSLLEHTDFIDSIKNTIAAHTNDNITDIQQTWEQLKLDMKTVSIIKATQINKIRKDRENELGVLINHATLRGKQNETHTLKLQTELDDIKKHRYKGAHIRTRFKNIPEETPTKQFLSIEKNVQKNRQINQIKDSQGNVKTDKQDITKAFEDYYRELYTAEQTDDEIQDYYTQFTKQLTEEQRQELDTELTLDELSNALNLLEKDKTGGPDGFSTEFFQFFFKELSPLFLALVKDNFSKESLTPSQYLSYITLIPKDGDPLEIKNYRGISLLNVDYKIITKALTIRLSKYMTFLIHTDQKCGVKGRNIQDLNHTIRDIITLAHDQQLNNLILSLDFSKAFDRVSHSFLHKILEHANFGPYFRTWIKILYKNPTSAILINHTLSDTFPLTQSVRQGCSLSPLLYVITLEPLLNKIRSDKRISGIFIPGGGVKKLVAYADDSNFFPGDFRSIKLINETFKHFGKGSGSKLNEDKGQALGIGKWESKANDPFKLNYVKEIKIFGIYYRNNRNQTHETVWKKLLIEIQSLVQKLSNKTASIFGRSVLVNTLVYPKILYLIHTQDPPKHITKQLNQVIREFIFKGTISNIRHTTLIQDKQNGGINLQDISSKTKALRIQHIRNIIENKETNQLAHYYIGTYITKLTTLDNNMPHFCGRLPSFYSNCRDTIRQYETLIKTTKTTRETYKSITKSILTPLETQIKRARPYGIIDFSSIFRNLHHKDTTAFEKQVTYRLLFHNTPTTGTCNLCKQTLETEEHIFYKCPKIKNTVQALTKFLTAGNNTPTDVKKAIFLHIPPDDPPDIKTVKIQILSTFRETIWRIRNDTKFNKKDYTNKNILDIFIHKTINNITNRNQWATFERLLL